MVILYCDENYKREREYIYDVLLTQFLGIEYRISFEQTDELVLEMGDSRRIHVNDTFFQQPNSVYLQQDSMPKCPLDVWKIADAHIAMCCCEDYLPIIYGQRQDNGEYVKEDNGDIFLGIDIFGSAFFMLTRYEECVVDDRDEHDRFPATASLACKEGFLERPIINEYVEILKCCLQRLNTYIYFRQHEFEIIATHDVDAPFWGINLTSYRTIRCLAGDLIKRRDVQEFSKHMWDIVCAWRGESNNSLNTFQEIMDIDEENGLKAFYFLMNRVGISERDGNYDIYDKRMVSLIKSIAGRGHKLGMHPSFRSYKDRDCVQAETVFLHNFFAEHGLPTEFGGRQHYLRWHCPTTWQSYEEAGLMYDMTLSYADHVGFRCGTCYEYPVFNILTRERLKLMEYPLLIMECSMLASRYMGLSKEAAMGKVKKLKEICKKYAGNFAVLWHNSSFDMDKDWEIYKYAVRRG